jgi:hypothetical protein
MKKLAVIVLVALCLLVVVDVALGYFLTSLANKPSANLPSCSMAESKARSAFVDSVTFEPSSFKWNGKQIVVREAWLEQQTELVHIHVIVPFIWQHYQYRQVGGYNLCFNLEETSYPLGDLIFVEEGKGSGFGMSGSVVLWKRLDDLDKFPTKILATSNWKFENSQLLTIKKVPK